MENYGVVSVIMPSYNTAEYIAETIESVRNQTYPYWELIIVDDCSTDNTDAVVANYLSDSRIRYLKNDRNSGAAVSRNRALREAQGKWVAFLDSDDLWHKEKLERQIRFMENNHYHFSYTKYCEIDNDGNKLGRNVSGPRKVTKRRLYCYCWMGCLTVMYNAQVVGKIQIKDIKKRNDYAMWLQVIKKTNCYLLKENLAFYRKRSGSISNTSYIKLVRWHYWLFRMCDERSKLVSCIFALCNIVFGVFKKMYYVRRVDK